MFIDHLLSANIATEMRKCNKFPHSKSPFLVFQSSIRDYITQKSQYVILNTVMKVCTVSRNWEQEMLYCDWENQRKLQ